MPRVDRAHIQAFEVRDTGVCGFGIIHEGVEGWPSCVLKESTAEQFPACGQDAYESSRCMAILAPKVARR